MNLAISFISIIGIIEIFKPSDDLGIGPVKSRLW